MIRNVFIVGIGGLVGSAARYLVVSHLTGSSKFPYGTFTVNIVGCLLIGLLAGFADRFNWLPEWRLFLGTGICAGFTTFSSLAIENVRLLQDKDYLTFFLYTTLSFVVGMGAAILGLAFARG